MTQVDQFESVFRAAAKVRYRHEPAQVSRVLCVTDRDPDGARRFELAMRGFLSVLDGAEWDAVAGDAYGDVQQLLGLVEERRPDVVVTYRHLQSSAWRFPFSLGVYLDVLTQVASCPVLVVPHPEREDTPARALRNTDSVMAITDHLTADDRLVRYAAAFTRPGGALHLTHVEDDATFERYLSVVSRAPSIDTDTFRQDIRDRLLKEPRDYIRSCREGLAAAGLDLDVREEVRLGHRLSEHRALVEQREVDLAVMNTRDDDQLAMHGLAYPLAVELRTTPLLLL